MVALRLLPRPQHREAARQGDQHEREREAAEGDQLHFVYGLLPLLCVAYPYALRGEDGRRNLLVFTIGSALVAALGIRAFMTGPH